HPKEHEWALRKSTDYFEINFADTTLQEKAFATTKASSIMADAGSGKSLWFVICITAILGDV
ncbi:hypothetical protein, partial [Cerasicoccus maritimus]|uniref:hypothetical protein n=1 Tax=Cerasicoccus maritimus TaxID=490089 RepID=UPI002852A9F0